MREAGADVLGLDWRTPLDQAWRALGHAVAVQGNLDPIALFAPPQMSSTPESPRFSPPPPAVPATSSTSATASSPRPRRSRPRRREPDQIHPPDQSHHLTTFLFRCCSMRMNQARPNSTAVLLLAHGTPDTLGEMAEYLAKVTGGRALRPRLSPNSSTVTPKLVFATSPPSIPHPSPAGPSPRPACSNPPSPPQAILSRSTQRCATGTHSSRM